MRSKLQTEYFEFSIVAASNYFILTQVKVEDCDIQDKESMLFAGTAISNGSCVGIVNSIGMQTEIGKIQQQIQDAAEEEEDSPLKKKIDNFGEKLAQVSAFFRGYRTFDTTLSHLESAAPKACPASKAGQEVQPKKRGKPC